MSAKQDTSNNNNMMSSCASCGKAEGVGIQLRTCTACKSVRYCGVTCQRNHRPQHKKACKKRAAELRDEILFRQPESTHNGDCPICCLPLPIDEAKFAYHACCSKLVCLGCTVANMKRLQAERLQNVCPFCRDVAQRSDAKQNMMKRIQANDPIAMCEMGLMRCKEGNYEEALNYYSKAAELGNARAHYYYSILYREGQGVEKDEKKEVYHLEEASIGGHPEARLILAQYEEERGNHVRAVKHHIIAANLGLDLSLHSLRVFYTKGFVNKKDFAAALSAYQAVADATKSPQRDEAAKVCEAFLAGKK